MDGGMRSGECSGIAVKKRNSAGCLIVRKKSSDAVGSSSGLKKEKKRPRATVLSDSGSSDELLLPLARRIAPETIRVRNGFGVCNKSILDESEFDKKHGFRHNDVDLTGTNYENLSKRKRNMLHVYKYKEYDRFNDNGDEYIGNRLPSIHLAQTGSERGYESGSGRHVFADARRKSYVDRSSSLIEEDHVIKNSFGMVRDDSQLSTSFLGDKSMGCPEEFIRVQGKNGVLKVMINKRKNMMGSQRDFRESRKISVDIVKRNVPAQPAFPSKDIQSNKKHSFLRKGKKQFHLQKSPSTHSNESSDSEAEDSVSSLKLGSNIKTTQNPRKSSSHEDEKAPSSPPTKVKEAKAKRSRCTEKQKLRENIRAMLVAAGWTIDYRPRRNRDYLDAVYINPLGTAYWSIIKAYDALQKQLNEHNECKPSGDGSSFTPISDEVLGQLTRKTKKKIEKEIKQTGGGRNGITKLAAEKTTKNTHYMENVDNGGHGEKLISLAKHGSESLKKRMNDNRSINRDARGQSSSHHLHDGLETSSHKVQGRKTKKLGRCTLLVRSSCKPMDESDGYILYTGKRTVLSWLIDSGTVQLSQKVQYMNRKRTRVMLKGWITRDGIHCGCCSKILTVSKFEVHAGSKLRQPFQNIYLDSGVSLLQCQIGAWNRQEEAERISFHTVDIDGDDPNDDTCGLCGDGGDLICCDSCPSTFHQSCLDIQVLPPGDWHCPNCTCKICGRPGSVIAEDGRTICPPVICSLCEKKYHEACVQKMDDLPPDAIGLSATFCGQKCKELFEQLQRYLGIKHELEAGFSWSLIHRMDADGETFLRGLPQRVEHNAKLAVALTVMEECFLPIVDHRSGINVIRNVVYNRGSNFSRLNYGGFYTAILERGDEIISAASLRFHGTRLAEMPFIGTRHIYRRQGMCHRLFSAIEAALCTLKVEKLIIPAVAELMHAWMEIFGFSPLKESLKRDVRSLNMLAFPGIDMLQKQLLKHKTEKSLGTGSDVEQVEHEDKQAMVWRKKSDLASSSLDDSQKSENADCDHANNIADEANAMNCDLQAPAAPASGRTVMSGLLYGSDERNKKASEEETACFYSQPKNRVAESALPKREPRNYHDASSYHFSGRDPNFADPEHDSVCPDVYSDASAVKTFQRVSNERNSHLGNNLPKSSTDEKTILPSRVTDNEAGMENNTFFRPSVKGSGYSSGEVHVEIPYRNASGVGEEPVCSSGGIVA